MEENKENVRVWYSENSFSINSWVVQIKTWYGRWKTVGRFYSKQEALNVKQTLIDEQKGTYRKKKV